MTEAIRVNFGNPLPVFPLPGAVLLPHALQPLHIFEERYKQMINDCLDESGQIAMASFAGKDWLSEYEGEPPLRPAVCIGQIVQHDRLPDGKHNILLQGVCRAKIVKLIEPDPADGRLYRLAKLAPLEPVQHSAPTLPHVRKRLKCLLTGPRLSRMRSVKMVMEWLDREDIPTPALLELIGFSLLRDGELRYRLLAESDACRRARIITRELSSLDHLIAVADRQPYRSWLKGMSWN